MEEASDVHRRCRYGNVALLSCPVVCQEIDSLAVSSGYGVRRSLGYAREAGATVSGEEGLHAPEDLGFGCRRGLSPMELQFLFEPGRTNRTGRYKAEDTVKPWRLRQRCGLGRVQCISR